MSLNLNLFNFYKRYKWTAQNFTDFQDAVVTSDRTASKGIIQAAAVEGLDVAPSGGGMAVSIDTGVAIAASGYLLALETADYKAFTAPVSNIKKSLLVIRPKITQVNDITKPTDPFGIVQLNQTQGCEVVIVDGTASATPTYPAKSANDVILCGVRLIAGQTVITTDDIDFSVREIPGQNAEIGQRVFVSDDRLRPYRSAYNLLGIKPAQKIGKGTRSFVYPGKGTPSIYPKDGGGLFTNSDSFLNFITGAITGGDASSSAFTPTIPTLGNSIVATVCLNTNDTINVLYGTQGTRAQCLDAIKNQVTTGAGSINNAALSYKIAFVVITSIAGSLADIEIFDVRALGGGGSAGSGIAIEWVEDENAPIAGLVNGFRTFDYDADLDQQILGSFKVPEGYSQGAQIKLKLEIFANTTANAALFQTVSTLIRNGTDAITSTTNQRTSSNSAQAFSAPANKPIPIELDLTDASGKINGVTVSANDVISFALLRSSGVSDTFSGTVSVLVKQCEIKIG